MNASKSLALAFCVGFFVAAPVTSCGPTAAGCDSDSCQHGCCDAAGKCQTSTSVFQCGNNGQSCQVCAATQQCIIGICTGGIGGGGNGSTGGGHGSTGGGNGSTGGGNGFTGGGFGVTGGGDGVTGGGFGVTGGGNGVTGGGFGVTGGGNGVTGGGSGVTGGGTTGGGTPTCSTATALTISGGEFGVSGTTSGAQNNIDFACTSGADTGEDIIYSFSLASSTLFTAYASFETTTGGLAIVQLGQCTSRNGTDCVAPTATSPYIQSTLPAGNWGLVVKTAAGSSGAFSISGYTETAATGGGSGTTGGGSGTTGGGSGATGGGSGTTGGGSGTGGGTGTGTALTNGSARSISGADSSQTIYYIDVPSGMSGLDITLTVSSGDPDLYERFNAVPTISSGGYDLRSANTGSDSLSISAPAAGRYYFNVYGYAGSGAYTATLTADYY